MHIPEQDVNAKPRVSLALNSPIKPLQECNVSKMSIARQLICSGCPSGISLACCIQLFTCEGTNLVCHFLTHSHLLSGQIFQVLASSIQETRKSQAGAIELANDHRSLMTIHRDEIAAHSSGISFSDKPSAF